MTRHRQKLAHELGVLSQLLYKYSSAHRSTKYLQAMKKVDRHMHEFSKMNVFNLLSGSCKNSEHIKKRAASLLEEVENNSLEVVRNCLPELALGHFITFHSLVVATISNIYALLQTTKVEIQKRLSSITKERGPHDPAPQLTSASISDSEKKLDLGTPVSRSEAMKQNHSLEKPYYDPALAKMSRASSQNIMLTFTKHDTNNTVDLGTPIPRSWLNIKQNNLSQDSCFKPVPPQINVLTPQTESDSARVIEDCKDISSNPLRSGALADMDMQPLHAQCDRNMPLWGKISEVHDSSAYDVCMPRLRIHGRSNRPLRVKPYHVRFALHCHRNNRSFI